MIKLRKHIAFRQTATLLIIGSLLCVLFGEGTHLHSVFNHLFDHGDIHTVVHAHSADEMSSESALHGDENHQHDVASVDLNGIFTQSGKYKVTVKQISIAYTPALDAISLWTGNQPSTLYDLPPPGRIFSQYYFDSFTLRGPPVT